MKSAEEYKKLKKIIDEAKASMDKMLETSNALDRSAIKKTQEYKDQVTILKETNEQINKIKEANKIIVDSLISQERTAKNLSGLQSLLKDSEIKRITLSQTLGTSQIEYLNSISDKIQDLSSLSSEDELARLLKLDDLKNEFDNLNDNKKISDELKNNLLEQKSIAEDISKLSKHQQNVLAKHLQVYDDIKDSIGGVLQTAEVLTSTTGGKLGTSLIGAGFLMEKLGHTAHKTGTFFDEMTLSATGLSFIFSDATSVAKGLSKELGGIEHSTFKAQLQANLLANNLDISGDEAASLIGAFSRLNDNSTDIASSTIQITKTLAKQHGVIPAQVMADMAGSTKAFAEYGKEGGRNIAEAAVYAAKLGVNMDALTTVTDSLLDFETSMTKELELGVLLGRNINLNKARQLAYDGEIGSAAKETLNQLGGINAFNQMDIYQKREAASLIGLSVEELQKMAANMDKLNADGSIQLSQAGQIGQKFDYISETMKGIITGPGGDFLKMLGSGAIAMGQMGYPLPKLLKGFKGIAGSVAETTKNLLSKGWKMLTGGDTGSQFAGGSLSKGKEILEKRRGTKSIPEQIKDSVVGEKKTPKLETDSVSEKLNKTTGGKGMNVTNMLKGAAAILVLSAALYVAAKAFQEFADVEWQDVTLGLGGLAGLAGIAMILGKAQGQLIKGALAVGILGAALIPFSFAMNLMSGIDMASVLSVASGLVIFSAAVFGLGALLSSGVGAFLFGAGLIALTGLGIAMSVLGAGLIVAAIGFQKVGDSMGSMFSVISEATNVLKSVGTTLGTIIGMTASVVGLSLVFAGLGASLLGLGISSMIALPGLLGISFVLGILSTSVSILSSSLTEIISSFSNLNMLTDIIGNLGSMVGNIALVTLSLAGLGASLLTIGVAGLIALPGLLGVSFALGIISTSVSLLDGSIKGIVSSFSSLGSLTDIISNISGMAGNIALVSLSLAGLGISLITLGAAGLVAMPGLMGVSIVLGLISVSTSLLSSSLQTLGSSVQSIVSSFSSLNSITDIISKFSGMITDIALISLGLVGLSISLITLGAAGLVAMPALVGISIILGLISVSTSLLSSSLQTLGSSITEIISSLSSLSTISNIITNLGSMIGTIGMISLVFLGLGVSLAGLGVASLVALPGLLGLSIVLGTIALSTSLLSSSIQTLGSSITEIISSLSSLSSVSTILGGLSGMIGDIALLSLGLLGLGVSLAVLGTTGLLAFPALVGVSIVIGLITTSISVLGESIEKMISSFSSLGTLSNIMVDFGSMVGTIGMLSLSFLGLGISLATLGVASLIALPGLVGLSIVFGTLALSTSIFSTSIKEMISTLTSLTSISDIISNLGGLVGTIGMVSLSFLGLGISLATLGVASLIALPGLVGLSIVFGTLALSTSIFSTSIKEMVATFSSLNDISSTVSNLAGMAGTIGMLSLSFLGLGISLAGLGAISLIALPGLLGLSIVLGLISSSVSLIGSSMEILGSSIEKIISSLSSLSSVSTILGGLSGMMTDIGILSVGLLGLGASLVTLGITSLLALPGLIGLSIILGTVAVSTSLLSGSIKEMMTSFTSLTDVSSIISNLGSTVGTIGMLSLAFLGLGVSLIGLGISGLIALPALFGISFALMIMATSIGTIGSSIESIVGSFSTMDDLGSKISNLVTMASGIGVLSLAFTGLAGSLVAVGTAGLIALPALMGLSMASKGLSVVADIFGMGTSSKETTAVEKGSVSEYETKMLQKMDELIGAVKSNRDVYIDKDKITKVLSKSLEKRTENLIGLSVA